MENKKCVFCTSNSSTPITFSCNHRSCSTCAMTQMLHNELSQLSSTDNLTIKCPHCHEGMSQLSIDDIISTLNTIANASTGYSTYCSQHCLPAQSFCDNCQLFLCFICIKEHKESKLNHDYKPTNGQEPVNKGNKQNESEKKLKLPLKFKTFESYCDNLEKSFQQYERDLNDNYNKIMKPIDEMIQTWTEHKIKWKNEMETKKKREMKVDIIFKLSYQRFYSEVSKAIKKKEYRSWENWCYSMRNQFNSREFVNIPYILEDLDGLKEQIWNYWDCWKEVKWKYNFPSISHVYSNKITISGHNDIINCAICWKDGNIASGARDSVIRIWDKKDNYKNIFNLEGHTGWISNLLLLSDNNLLSGSYDGSLKIWDYANNYANIMTLTGHTSWVSASIQLSNGTWLSSSFDNTIIARSNKKFKPWSVLKEHTFGVFALCLLSNNSFASGSGDKTIKIWNQEFGVEKIIKGHNSTVDAIVMLKEENCIASGSLDKTIKIWDYISGDCLFTIKSHNDGVCSLIVLSDGRIVSGGADNLIKIWDCENGFNCTHILKGHSNVVTSLIKIDDDDILSSSADKRIKIWVDNKSIFGDE